MRIALTFNEKRSDSEREAEYDSLDTIHAIARMLASLGHVVTPLEVSGPLDAVLGELRRLAPDLAFNLAEGSRGRFREAFFPALFEQLGIPHTGSDASTLALCMDKALAKRIVAAARVPTPASQLARHAGELVTPARWPVIVKPNAEGSSKGITQASVVTSEAALQTRLGEALDAYPEGVLIEQFVDGVDVAVGWVEGIGLLPPIGYAYPVAGEHAIYDLALKSGPPDAIDVQVPARLDTVTTQRLLVLAQRAFTALGIRGYGRADFRVAPDGGIYFLEMNPLPTLDPAERDLYAAGAAVGTTPRELLAAIVGAACPVLRAHVGERLTARDPRWRLW